MSFALIIHKFALLVTLIFGILYVFKKSNVIKTIHYIAALIFVSSIFLYFIESKFSQLGYVIYGFLLLLVFFSPKFYKKKGKLFVHIGLFITAICCLVIIHIV